MFSNSNFRKSGSKQDHAFFRDQENIISKPIAKSQQSYQNPLFATSSKYSATAYPLEKNFEDKPLLETTTVNARSVNSSPEIQVIEASPASKSYQNPYSQMPAKKTRGHTSRDEMNLAEFPLAVLSTRVDSRVKTLEFTDYTKGPNNEMVERRWIITGADKFGLPTSTDDDVVLGLIRLSMESGFKEPKVYFTRYELLKALRWSTEGRSYQRLIKSLDRLSGVRVRSSNSFYDNSTKSYQTSNFGIIDAYEINDERGSAGDEKASFFIWSEMLFNSFKSGYIKKLDLDLYFTLKSAVARRLYRYLDKHFYFKGVIDSHLMTLAFEKIGLSRSYKYISSIKQQLKPALEELRGVGFLSKYEYVGDGEATILRCYSNAEQVSSSYGKKQIQANDGTLNQVQTQKHKDQLSGLDEQQRKLVTLLTERGLGLKQSKSLICLHDKILYPRIESILTYFDYLVATNDKKISKNPVGFLYRAIEMPLKINLPKEFLSHTTPKPERIFRPEHKVVRANKQPKMQAHTISNTQKPSEFINKASTKEREEYQTFIQNELNCVMTRMAPVELGQLFAETQDKMKSLKRILDEAKFLEAVEGCVRDELRRRFRLPQFEEWLKIRN